jgi:transmembrane sensor
MMDNPDMNQEEYLRKWLNDELTESDQEALRQREDLRPVRRLISAIPRFRAPEYDTEAELQRFRLRQPQKMPAQISFWRHPVFRVAAVLLILIGLYATFLQVGITRLETLAGEKKSLVLPDGSQMDLNAGSRVSFRRLLWNRSLSLEGEAFFSVEKGSGFSVRTASGVVRVLGTKFNVSRRPGFFEVTCYEGLVEVRHGGSAEELSPGQAFRVVDREKIISRSVDRPDPDWMSGQSVFRSIPYGLVVAEFERQYGIEVQTHGIDTAQQFTGRFSHSDLDKALKSITLPLRIRYEMTGENTVLLKADAE